ncbi:PKD domain-containing protein [Pelagicoccus enzymogenes]|uniref:PKD domain-containing protein n=1 Tax=Pelagicoccus enzymogenes TaxID=2773457 RepID=UPI00280CB064|nr:PKD domain-containing protein [Pelagicoccus enzymogenes]MDQ8199283.1 PKD domain-containing protein [Pelagicoccus enzymogenes]
MKIWKAKRTLFTLLSLTLVASFAILFPLLGPASKDASAPRPRLAQLVEELESSGKTLLQQSLVLANSDTDIPEKILEQARARAEAMSQLMESNPQRALDLAFSYAAYASLPPEIQAIVERPFTEIADYRAVIICDHDSSNDDQRHSLQFADGRRLPISRSDIPRLFLSKEKVPLQGIELAGKSVVRTTIFQELGSEDAAWASDHLPLANVDPAADFLNGAKIDAEPLVAVSGGYRFHFASSQSIAQLESLLGKLDARPGLAIGSPAFLAKLPQEDAPFNAEAFLSAQEVEAAPPPDEVRDYLIIRVAFSDLPETPYSKEDLEALIDNNVAPYLTEYSYNKTTVDVAVTESVYQLAASTSFSNTDDLHDAAVAAYMADGNVNPNSQYEVVSVIFPKLDFEWTQFAGLASVGGREQWLNGKANAETCLHELGHNYGLAHATYWKFDNSNAASLDPIDPSGAEIDYGDIFDVMGDGEVQVGHFHMPAKRRLGWLDESNFEDLTSGNDSGTYRVYSFDSAAASGIQALRIPKSGSEQYYWVGHRMKYPGIPNLSRGAYLLWERPISFNTRSMLIDTTPGSPDGRTDAGLALGRTFSDIASGVHITPVGAGQNSSGSYLDIVVNLGDFSGNQSPRGTLTASSTGEARSEVAFSFEGSDPDGDSLSYHWDFGDGTVEVSSAAVNHSFPVGGTYTLNLTVSDMKGGTYTASATVEVSDPITEFTSANIGSNLNLQDLAANGTHVVAVGTPGAVLSSADGDSWTQTGGSAAFNKFFYDVIWTGSEFMAVGGGSTGTTSWTGTVIMSPDGQTWTSDYTTSATVGSRGFVSAAYNPLANQFAVIASDGSVHLRDDQGNWTSNYLYGETINVSEDATILFRDGSYLVGGYRFGADPIEDSLILLRSADGLIWEDLAKESGFDSWKGLHALAQLGGELLGSGFAADIRYSTDGGDTWTSNQETQDFEAESFAWGNDIFFAHGLRRNTGAAQNYLSTDGRNWKPITTSTGAAPFNDCIFFKDTFILAGDQGALFRSSSFGTLSNSPFQAWIVGFVSDESEQGAVANPDLDWAPNFMEFALGSDPSDPASVPTPPSLTRNSDGTLTVSIPRFAKTDIVLSLEWSTNLTVWSDLSATISTDSDALLELTTSQSFTQADAVFIRIKANQ